MQLKFCIKKRNGNLMESSIPNCVKLLRLLMLDDCDRYFGLPNNS